MNPSAFILPSTALGSALSPALRLAPQTRPAACPTRAAPRAVAEPSGAAAADGAGVSRRQFVLAGVAAAIAASAVTVAPEEAVARAIDPLKEPLVAIVLSKKMLVPVYDFVKKAQWDKARTNVTFCTRYLRLKSCMKKVAESFDEEAFFTAAEFMGDMDNLFTQLDASVYTSIFIPADEGEIPPEARKYQNQAYGYLDTATKLIDDFLALCPPDQVKAACEIADKNPVKFREYA